MSLAVRRPDLDQELSVLKDFQRRTVDRVHEQFWHPTDPTRRFLVADEVGLGKTLVARGVIAKTIDHLWDTVPRIDVVYICSNGQIARQNLPKLRVGDEVAERHHADRLTMLASELHHLEGRKLNFVSFTPGTSFNVGGTGGRVEERVLLYWLLRKAWGGTVVRPGPWTRFFRGRVDKSRFERRVQEFDPSVLSDDLVADFAESVRTIKDDEGVSLAERLLAGVDEYRQERGGPDRSPRRYQLVGQLRRALARAAVKRLEPDLVILDEFQRFKDLMSEEGEGADLARELFDHGDARLLLLSATPFKMYTLPDEPEGDDHYDDFINTVRFLAGEERARAVQRDLATLRSSLFANDHDAARAARDRAQQELRRVMSRTERLAGSADRDGFVVEGELPQVQLSPTDVKDYRRLTRVSDLVDTRDPLEFWRAAPYVLELMESYQVKSKLQRLHEARPDDPGLVDAVAADGAAALRWDDIQRYARIDPGNAKMRGLAADVLDRGAWELAWIPPSLPYYEAAGPFARPELRDFTKRLIFSAWAVAPKAIGTVISYEAERRIAARATRTSMSSGFSRYDGTRTAGLLNFNRSEGRLSGMPVLGILYPSVALAEVGDPLRAAAELDARLPMSRSALEGRVREGVRGLLAELPPGPETGAVDERWYWAAGILLDRSRQLDALDELSFGSDYGDDDDPTRFNEHLDLAHAVEADALGRRPHDLEEILTLLAMGGPGVVGLRALARVASIDDLTDPDLRDAASHIAWSLRNMVNKPELMGIIRGSHGRGAYWQDVLAYSVDGVLESVLDEYLYLLDQAVGGSDEVEGWHEIADRFAEATSLRTSMHSLDDIEVRDGVVSINRHRTRTHLAVRFGRGVAEDDKSVMREGQVRAAFNSPFWPFVLASTSVGQEGLDFHHYCHAVVHWNLPANPVDLEQREGRVHRYQGHAVRRNVAAGYGQHVDLLSGGNPWPKVFDLAAADRAEGMSELYPSWTPPLVGTARIERYVPALPLSRETHAVRRLLRTVGAYRLVLGQPRQSDLLQYLGDQVDGLEGLRIDLEP